MDLASYKYHHPHHYHYNEVERPAEMEPKNENRSVCYDYFFECNLKYTLAAKNVGVSS